MKSINTIIDAKYNLTIWNELMALSKYAGHSEPERFDAIQRLTYAIKNYEMRDWHKQVLNKIIELLKIEPA